MQDMTPLDLCILVIFAILAALIFGSLMVIVELCVVWFYNNSFVDVFLFGLIFVILPAMVAYGLEHLLNVGFASWLFPIFYSAPTLWFGFGSLADPTAGEFWVSVGFISTGSGLAGIWFAHHRQGENTSAL